MSANDYLLDANMRHQIFVQRYAGGQVKELVSYLNDAQSEIKQQLDGLEDLSQTRTLERKLRRIERLQQDALSKLGSDLVDNTADFAEYEADFLVRTLETASSANVTLPSSEQLRALVTERPMELAISGASSGSAIQSLTINQAVNSFSDSKATEIKRLLQTGVVQGSTVQELTSNLVRMTDRHKRQAEALVRTSVNHISSEARTATHKANSDILKGEEFVATLDGRTTIGCAALDGKIFDFDEGPQTPRHWNCRSIRVPVLQDRFQEGGLEGQRASASGPVSAKRTYSGWLKDQPKSFQDQVLGRERAKLFRAGKFNLDQFVDMNGNPINLKQLKLLDDGVSAAVTRVSKTGTGKIPGRPVPFKPAKTIKEAEKYAVDNGLARVADFGKLDIEVANLMNQSMQENIERMPALKGRMSFIGSGQANNRIRNAESLAYNIDWIRKNYPELSESEILRRAKRRVTNQRTGREYAFARSKPSNKNNWQDFYKDSDGIGFNEKWSKPSMVETFKKMLDRDVKSQWHPVGTESLRSVMDHEIGHQIDYMLDLSKNAELKSLFRSSKPNMKQDLSQYAAKNIAEFIAESWAEYVNNPTPRPLAKQVGDIMNAEYQKKFGDFGS